MELEDDRRFLDFEIRDCRLQNQNLKVTISKTHNKCDELNATKDELVNKYANELSQNAQSVRAGSMVSGYHGMQADMSAIKAQDLSQIHNSSYMHKDTELTTNRLKYDSARGGDNTLPTQRYDLDETANMLLEAQADDEEDNMPEVELHRQGNTSTTNIVIRNNRQPHENTFGERLET